MIGTMIASIVTLGFLSLGGWLTWFGISARKRGDYAAEGLEIFGVFILLFSNIFVFGLMPDSCSSRVVASTKIEAKDYTVAITPNQIGVVYRGQVLLPDTYEGKRAVETGEFSVYEQIQQSNYFLYQPTYEYVKLFNAKGDIIAEKKFEGNIKHR